MPRRTGNWKRFFKKAARFLLPLFLKINFREDSPLALVNPPPLNYNAPYYNPIKE
jgi:hypothetical protein